MFVVKTGKARQGKARATCRISKEARLGRQSGWYLLTSTMGGRGLGWRWEEHGGGVCW